MSAHDTDFVTFGGGFSRVRRAARRLSGEARDSGVFRSVEPMTDTDLNRHHRSFVERNAELLRLEVRGFGYWIWKPYVIQAALRPSTARYVLYADAGCVFNLGSPRALQRLAELHDLAEQRGLAVSGSHLPEQTWCKADTMERIGITLADRSSGQMQATFLLIRNSSTMRDLVDVWVDLCHEGDHRFLDETPSVLPNAPSFIEHRHDQAILSCLCKREGIEPVMENTWFPRRWSTDGADAPLWAARHKWGSPFRPDGPTPLSHYVERAVDRAERFRRARG